MMNWTVDFEGVKKWLYTDQANVRRLIDWMDATLSQANIDAFAALIGSATTAQKQETFKEIRAQLGKLGLNEQDAGEKAVLDALDAVLAVKETPVEAEPLGTPIETPVEPIV